MEANYVANDDNTFSPSIAWRNQLWIRKEHKFLHADQALHAAKCCIPGLMQTMIRTLEEIGFSR